MKSEKEQFAKIIDSNPNEIIESNYDVRNAAHYASLFSLANGYLGIRAGQEDLPIESFPVSDGISGTFVNGFYETKDIVYGESAYGFADTGETIQNLANPLPIELSVDGEIFNINEVKEDGRLVEYSRKLLLDEAILVRNLTFETKTGKKISINSRRLVSFSRRTTAVLEYSVTNLSDEPVDVSIKSYMNARTTNKSGGDDPRLAQGSDKETLEVLSHELNDLNISLLEKAPRSELEIALSVEHEIYDAEYSSEGTEIHLEKTLGTDETYTLEKYIAVVDKRHAENEMLEDAIALSKAAKELGFNALYEEQVEYIQEFKAHSAIEVEGDDTLQQALNFSTFHLLQSAPDDGLGSVSAKGLSGEGYEGHYFWDTEMYVLPFFIYTKPQIAKSLLEYRYSLLDQARDRAKLMGHNRGALYPWRTISGRELSAYYAAGTAQSHINGDISLAVARYVDASQDLDFLQEQGLEILLETAVYYLDLGYWHRDKGFVINSVTGPDEYSTVVDNNYFTNLIVQINFDNVLKFTESLDEENPGFTDELFSRLGYDKETILADLKKASEGMFFGYSEELGIPLQDEKYIDRKPWDFLGVDESKYPLLLNYHPLEIYRHRVSKQADMVFAQHLAPARFTAEEHRKSYNYYELFSTHDSSLSVSMYSIMANFLGQEEKAYHYFMETARLDLDNTHKNTADGLHLANMAGNYTALTDGYAGMRVVNSVLTFNPKIAKQWASYSLRINFNNCLIKISVNKEEVIYELLEGERLMLRHAGEEFELSVQNAEAKFALVETEQEVENIDSLVFTVDDVLLNSDSEILPGIVDKLDEFIDLGYKLHLDASSDEKSKLEELGLLDKFSEEEFDINNSIYFTAEEDRAVRAVEAGYKVFCLSYLAADFLDIGTHAGAWGLDRVFAEDLAYV